MVNIYVLKFPNGKHYVGRTKNSFEQRLTEHKSRIGKYHHPLYYACKKYGWSNIEKVILETVGTHEEAVIRELHHILEYDSLVNGYNLTINTEVGGDVWEGRRDTDQYQEFVKKMKEINSTGRMHGKSHTNNTKTLMKEKAKGRFSLPWYVERFGEEEGTEKYKARCKALSNRNLKKDKNGRFSKK